MKARIWKGHQKGQSLVEVALALPILLMLAIGIVELGYALNAYIQTVNAAREGARFGSLGGSNTAVTSIVQGATAYLTTYDDTNADLYVIRAKMNGIAPNCAIESYTCMPTVDSSALDTSCPAQDEILDRLETDGLAGAQADELERFCDYSVVGVDLYYRSSSLLGLPLVKQLSEAVSMRTLSVMRAESPRPLSGVCNVYPIAIHISRTAGKGEGERMDDMYNGGDPGNFGWLRWPNDPSGGSSENLADALSSPRSDAFENAMDPDDHQLTLGDWVWANTGVSNDVKVRNALDKLISKGNIRVVVWDMYEDTGSGARYRVANFAIVRLVAYDLAKKWIRADFVGYDATGCVE